MKKYRIEEFTKGWVLGDFEPTIYKTSLIEVGMKSFLPDDTEPSHFQNIATEITIVASGTIEMNGVIFSEGDIIVIEPGEVANFKSLSPSKLFCIKYPSIPLDKVIA
jgi:quercetin dioxygenase-like cupin family protein